MWEYAVSFPHPLSFLHLKGVIMNHAKKQTKATQKTNRYFIRNRIHELNGKFKEVTRRLGSNLIGTQLNQWQTDFIYMINEAKQGPYDSAPRVLLRAETLISQIKETRTTT